MASIELGEVVLVDQVQVPGFERVEDRQVRLEAPLRVLMLQVPVVALAQQDMRDTFLAQGGERRLRTPGSHKPDQEVIVGGIRQAAQAAVPDLAVAEEERRRAGRR